MRGVAKTEKIRGNRTNEAMPAGCGWTWSRAHHLSHQPSQNTNS